MPAGKICYRCHMNRVIKNGISSNGYQRYRCSNCGHSYTSQTEYVVRSANTVKPATTSRSMPRPAPVSTRNAQPAPSAYPPINVSSAAKVQSYPTHATSSSASFKYGITAGKADLFLTIFLGWAGYWRFRRRQIGLGVLWACTFGAYFVGWIIDIVQVSKAYCATPKPVPVDHPAGYASPYAQPAPPAQNAAPAHPFIAVPALPHPETKSLQMAPDPVESTDANSQMPMQSVQRFTVDVKMDSVRSADSVPITSEYRSVNEPEIKTSPKKEIKQFSFEEAVSVYFNTDHKSCKSIYDYNSYFADAFSCILTDIPRVELSISDTKVLRQNAISNPIEDTKNITKSTPIRKIKDFVAIDTETTGLKPGGNDIVEICAIKFKDFKPAEKLHTYLKPRKPIPAEASMINHITDDMVADAPTFAQIRDCLQDFIGDAVLVAHNAPFDIRFLHASGLNLENHSSKVYDTLQLAKLKIRDFMGDKLESYKLESICINQNIRCKQFHSAAVDTLACGILFVDIVKQIHEIQDIDMLLQSSD